MYRAPHHRLLAVLDAIEAKQQPPPDPKMVGLYKHLLKQPGVPEDVAYAHDLYVEAEHRCVLDAFILAKVSTEMSSRILEIDPTVLETYEYLFMDRSVFRNKLEVWSFAASFGGSDAGKELMRAAVQVGPEYMLWMYGEGAGEIDTRYIVRKTMVDSFFRGMAHKGNTLTSPIAKEAQKWWATAIHNAEIMERLEPRAAQNALEELRIALIAKDETAHFDAPPVPISKMLS